METKAQALRQTERERNGRYSDYPKCEACGRSTGYGYWSLSTCDDDAVGVVLCNRGACAGRFDSEAAIHAHILKRQRKG